MAWTHEDNFDGYSDGDLNGQGSWSGSTLYDVQGSVVYQGAKAVSRTTFGTGGTIANSVTAVTAGSLFIAMRKTSSTQGSAYTMLQDSGEGVCCYVRMHNDSKIYAYNAASGYVNMGSYASNTWCIINIEWDDSAHPNQWRCRFHDGSSWSSWTSWIDTYNAITSGIDGVVFDIDNTGGTPTAYWDLLTPTDPTAGGATWTPRVMRPGQAVRRASNW